jgi:hypothetical protein
MDVWVVSYFYPGGVYAGIIGVYDSEGKADGAIALARADYSDCTFVATSATVE